MPKYETAIPSFNFFWLHGVKHFAKFLRFLISIAVGRTLGESVKFLIVVIFNRFRCRLHHTFLFAAVIVTITSGARRLFDDRSIVLRREEELQPAYYNASDGKNDYEYDYCAHLLTTLLVHLSSLIISNPTLLKSLQKCG